MEKKEIGNLGEDIALKCLVEKGYTILEKNWRFGHLELDIIALSPQKIIAFVEVKSRTVDYFAEPEMTLTKKQQSNLIKAANVFLEISKLDYEAQFDIISVVIHPKGNELNHLENAFYPYQK
jgi:putative endonuclease